MNAFARLATRALRGPAMSRMLRAFGIDPKRYWLLMQLFSQVSERREFMGDLGRSSVTLKAVALVYFFLMGIIAVVTAITGVPLSGFFVLFQIMNAFMMLMILLPETSNSLVNPQEALILAHQPVDGATYTAAKLSHLLFIVLYLVPGLNLGAALAGLMIAGAPWFYPLLHLATALLVGIVAALACCAAFGLLVRFVPPSGLKTAAQIAEMSPWLIYIGINLMNAGGKGGIRRLFGAIWLPEGPLRFYLGVAAAAIAIAAFVFGIRSLSADYLIRASRFAKGRPDLQYKPGRSRLGEAVALVFGGPASRGGFEFVSCMMWRDWQFKRALVPMLPMVILPLVLIGREWRTTPWSPKFSGAHVIPHIFGLATLFMCSVLPYGTDHKASWMFLLAPARALREIAGGVYAALWLRIIVIPHIALLAAFGWAWSFWQAFVFVAYSLALSTAYLGLEIRLVNAVPFSKPFQAGKSALSIPLLAASFLVMGMLVGLQYIWVFGSIFVTVAATVLAAIAAFFAVRTSLPVFESAMRFSLSVSSEEIGPIYKEIG